MTKHTKPDYALPATSVITQMVAAAVAEDVGSGDLTAMLIPPFTTAHASVITREDACLCGTAWFDEVFAQIDPEIDIIWQHHDGDFVTAGATLCLLSGPARSLLTGERIALNFLQMLSGTATVTRNHVAVLAGSKTQLLDTRKTIPGFRLAQKYAVRCGGGTNHRIGLYDAFLIKENHIAAAGSITQAVRAARTLHPEKTIEVEVETLDELDQALAAQANIIMLDNFDDENVARAVLRTGAHNAAQSAQFVRTAQAENANFLTKNAVYVPIKLEVSGNVERERLQQLATLGVDYVSAGALTKHVRAIDLSMRFLDSKTDFNAA